MNETHNNFSELDLSYEEAIAHIGDTIDRLDLLSPGADIAETVDRVVAEYVTWRSRSVFTTASGVDMTPPVYTRDPDGVEDDLHNCNIPPELGYNNNGETWIIDFTPPHTDVEYNYDEKVITTFKTAQPFDDQKFMAIRHGLEGALDFITLVEAGMIPKPANIVGLTNPTMARFSERAGLQTAASISNEMVRGGIIEDEDTHKIANLEADIQQAIHQHNEGLLDEMDVKEVVRMAVKMAALAKARGDKTAYHDLTRTANNLMLNNKDDRDGGILVWGTYEDFREGVLDMKDKFGERIHRLAEREHAVLVA